MQHLPALMLFFAICLPVPATLAQEQLPPPPDNPALRPQGQRNAPESNPADVRQQRRQRLFGLGRQLLDQFAPGIQGNLNPPAANQPDADPPAANNIPAPANSNPPANANAAPPAAEEVEPLDAEKINRRFDEVVQPIVNEQPEIETFSLGFIPGGTDLLHDQLRFGGEVILRRSAWSEARSRLRFSIGLRVVTEGFIPRCVVDGDLELDTDMIGLMNYGLMKLQQGEPLPAGQPNSGADALFQARLHELLLNTPPMTSFEDTLDTFTNISAVRIGTFNEEIARLKSEMSLAATEDERRDLYAELMQVRQDRDKVMFGERRHIVRDDLGHARGLHLTLRDTDLFGRAQAEQVDVALSEYHLKVDAVGSFTQGVAFWFLAKPIVLDRLRAFQRGDAPVLNRLRGWIRFGVDRARGPVFGHAQP